ncbi:sialate O-acetylesterase [Spirosoma rhododendri]|uniref:T9SS type A sorting domain-containing protein n=1 Tax=Spirosoma rhododendri TaxID=2728024 RepID=A0A7L5DU00_9BACT|nr:sialate O-acetylesterase [Spirosoma rhododendri]QJD79040.1 T9SS type A sorting domain-containing protein [Spirosoma rhododendri]
MKHIYPAVLLFLVNVSLAQVRFGQLPKDLQLYPRTSQNQASVPISGTVNATGFRQISVQLWREGKLSTVVSQTLSMAAASQPFQLSALIKAEPAEYRFRIFLYKNNDSTLVADRQRVVCGDVYVLYGQSNIIPGTSLAENYGAGFNDRYLRNYTYINGGDPVSTLNWYPAKEPFASVGTVGLNIQRLILEQYGIPTVVINGAIGGATITELSARDPLYHGNTNTSYGRLLTRVQLAGLQQNVKAILWRQGEAESGGNATGYGDKFATLYKQLREDYGNARLYVAQANLLGSGSEAAGTLRDFQRRTRQLFSNVATIATVGTRDYDGIHYFDTGYRQLAFEQFRLLARDFYGATDTLQIGSPDIQKVVYNARRDSVTLVFEPSMQMVWRDTTYYSFATGAQIGRRFQKDAFFLDNKAGLVTNGAASGNRVILRLNAASSAKTLTYMSPYFSDALSPFYNGPTLRNSRGMRAFTFADVAIADRIATPTQLAATPIDDKQIRLTWSVPTAGSQQIVERAVGQSGSFQLVKTLDGTTRSYVDTGLPDPYALYRYRVRVLTQTSESDYSAVARVMLLILGLTDAPVVSVYPNPVGPDRQLNLDAGSTTVSTVVIRDMQGQVVSEWRGRATSQLQLPLHQLPSGLYVTDMNTTDGQVQQEKIVIR